jgi:hypothetical protein
MNECERLWPEGPSMPVIVQLWQSCAPRAVGGAAKHLTPRELGQLKALRTRLGVFTAPTILWTTQNWPAFSEFVISDQDLSGAPGIPHIGFLLAHHYSAIEQMEKEVPGHLTSLLTENACGLCSHCLENKRPHTVG